MRIKKYIYAVIFSIGSILLVSCSCETCRKEGYNEVTICEKNYNDSDDYQHALDVLRESGFECH